MKYEDLPYAGCFHCHTHWIVTATLQDCPVCHPNPKNKGHIEDQQHGFYSVKQWVPDKPKPIILPRFETHRVDRCPSKKVYKITSSD